MKALISTALLLLTATPALGGLAPELEAAKERNVSVRRFDDGDQKGLGSGINVGGHYVLTNAHVVGAGNLFIDDHTVPARIVAVNEREDLALLQDSQLAHLPSVSLSSDVEVTDQVCYVGNPVGLEDAVVCGRITAIKGHWLYIDAAVGKGISGAGLWNGDGELVGVMRGMNSNGVKGGGFMFGMAKPASVIVQFLGDVGMKVQPDTDQEEGEE